MMGVPLRLLMTPRSTSFSSSAPGRLSATLGGRIPIGRAPVCLLVHRKVLELELAVDVLDAFRYAVVLKYPPMFACGRPAAKVASDLAKLICDGCGICDRRGLMGSPARSASVLRLVGGSGTANKTCGQYTRRDCRSRMSTGRTDGRESCA